MFIPKSINKIELKENLLVVDSKELNYGNLTEDDKEVLNTMISKGSKYLPLLYLNNKYMLESIDGKKLNKLEYLTYLLECKRIKKAGVRESDTHLRPLANVGNLEILESDNNIYFGKEGKFYRESLKEGRLWGEYEDAEDIEREKKIAQEMYEYAMALIEAFKKAGWNYDDSSAKYGHYKFSKNGVNAEYCDNFDKMGSADIESEVLKGLTEDEREDFGFDPGNVGDDYAFIDFRWRHPVPEKVVKFVEYAVSKSLKESINPDLGAVEDPALNAEEEAELDSLYDRDIKEYKCKYCGKVIPNILDWDKKHYKEYGNEYYCPYCGELYTFEEVKDVAVFKEGAYPNFDLPEGYPQEVYDKYFEYTEDIDLTDDEPLDFSEWYKNNIVRNIKVVEPEEMIKFIDAWEVSDDSVYGDRLLCHNENKIIAIDNSKGEANIKEFGEDEEAQAREWLGESIELVGEKVIKECPMCDRVFYIDLTKEEADKYESYLNGEGLIQDIFPELNVAEREFLKMGYCPGCQEILFDSDVKSDRIKESLEEDAGTQVGDIAPKEDYIKPMVKVSTKKKNIKESEEENFKDMVMELHSYVEADPKRISSDLQDTIKNNKLDDYLKSKAAMSDEEVKDFKERYLKEPLKEDAANITDIEYVEPNYTGGGVYVYTGKLKDGNYFLGGDDWFDNNNKMFMIRVVDENPDDYEEDCWFDDWQQEHLVRDLTEEENKEITKQILHWIIENKPDGNYDIRNMEDMLDTVEPKKIEEAVNIPQGSEEACAYIFRKYRDEYDSINEVRWDQDRINELFDEGGMEKVNNEFFLPGASPTYRRDYKLLIYPQNIEKQEKEKEAKRKEREEKEKSRKPRKAFTVGDIVDRLNKDLNKDNIGAYPPSGQGDNTIKVRKIDERFGLRFYTQMTYEEIPYDSFAISFNNVLSKKFTDKVQPIIDLNRGTYTRRLGSERVFPEDFVFYIYKYDDVDKLAEVMKQILNEPAKVEESAKVGDKISFYSNGYKTNGKWSNKRDIKMNTEVTRVLPNGAVSARDPQGEKGFDYISPGEIVETNGELNPKLEYFAQVYYSHDNGDHDHKWNKKEIKDWVKDEIEMGNDMFDLDSDTLNMLYQFQHELYQEDKKEGLI